MTLQLTPALEQRLEQLAVQANRTPDELAQEAIDHFLTYQEHFLAAVKEGDDDISRGDIVTHENVVAQIEALLKKK